MHHLPSARRLVGAFLCVPLATLLVTGCASESPAPSNETVGETAQNVDETGFGQLLCDLVEAYERPCQQAEEALAADLEVIHSRAPQEFGLAQDIASQWNRVYVNPDYQLRLYGGGELAPELEEAGLEDSDSHAFVVLGYELRDGQMTDELRARCDAAAAAARTFPSSILVCSGGATGPNNPERHTEAGLMRDYLADECGIDEERIFIDERAMTTAENAQNTLDILQQNGIQTMTIVTSSYHQRWGQAVYNAAKALYARDTGYSVDIVENYCADIAPENPLYRQDDRIAVRQIGELLGLDQKTLEMLPPFGA